jgi:hypothetical protein
MPLPSEVEFVSSSPFTQGPSGGFESAGDETARATAPPKPPAESAPTTEQKARATDLFVNADPEVQRLPAEKCGAGSLVVLRDSPGPLPEPNPSAFR